MLELLKSLSVGIVCGAVFSFFKLPVPAPTALAGILGIAGIWIGYEIIQYFIN